MARYIQPLIIRKITNGIQFYKSVIPQEQPQEAIDYLYTARVGDRWDTIAHKYLGAASLWYVVARANGGLNGSLFIKPGTVIKIPRQ